MQKFFPDREEIATDYVLTDCEGDLWLHVDGSWRYLTDEGLTVSDGRDELPEEYAPYRALSELSARAIRAALTR